MDNTKEFRLQKFEDYCVATSISLTYAVLYEHAQNGLAEAFIKKIQLISRPLLLHAKTPFFFLVPCSASCINPAKVLPHLAQQAFTFRDSDQTSSSYLSFQNFWLPSLGACP